MPIPNGAMPPTPCTTTHKTVFRVVGTRKTHKKVESTTTDAPGAAPNPIGATPGGGIPILGGGTFPLPTPRAIPGPPDTLVLELGGGGPSTAMLTTFSPLKIINPSERFSTRSSRMAARDLLRVRNSSASTRTRLRCLSNARKVPTMVRLSTREMRRRCSMYLNNLDPLPDGCGIHTRYSWREKTSKEIICAETKFGSFARWLWHSHKISLARKTSKECYFPRDY